MSFDSWLQSQCVEFGANRIDRLQSHKLEQQLSELDENRLFIIVFFVVTVCLFYKNRSSIDTDVIAVKEIVDNEIYFVSDDTPDSFTSSEYEPETTFPIVVTKVEKMRQDIVSVVVSSEKTAVTEKEPYVETIEQLKLTQTELEVKEESPDIVADNFQLQADIILEIEEQPSKNAHAETESDREIVQNVESCVLEVDNVVVSKTADEDLSKNNIEIPKPTLQSQLTKAMESSYKQTKSVSLGQLETPDLQPIVKIDSVSSENSRESSASSGEASIFGHESSVRSSVQNSVTDSPKVRDLIEIFENIKDEPIDPLQRISSNGTSGTKSSSRAMSVFSASDTTIFDNPKTSLSSSPLREFSNNITLVGPADDSDDYTKTPTKNKRLSISSLGLMTSSSTKPTVTIALNETPTKGSIRFSASSKSDTAV